MTTKHIHAEVMTQWINDQSLIVECYRESRGTWMVVDEPMWYHNIQYRIKPKAKVVYAEVYYSNVEGVSMGVTTEDRCLHDNLKITFEGTNVTNMEFLK
jgi:hypothetical protein